MRFILPLVMAAVMTTGAMADEPTPAEELDQSVLQPTPEPTHHRIQEEPGVQVQVPGVRVVVGYQPIYGVVPVQPRPRVRVVYVPRAYPTGCVWEDWRIRRSMIHQIRRHGAIAVQPQYLP